VNVASILEAINLRRSLMTIDHRYIRYKITDKEITATRIQHLSLSLSLSFYYLQAADSLLLDRSERLDDSRSPEQARAEFYVAGS